MILPDAAIWIDHLRRSDAQLEALLLDERVAGHTFVTGEVSLGSIAQRSLVLERLGDLPQLRVAAPEQVTFLIEKEQLWSKGIGYVDAHLLASVMIAEKIVRLWTRDNRLRKQAERLGIAYTP